MANTWRCHVCGGDTKEYDPIQRCVVCLGCGTPVSDEDQNARAGYERNKTLIRDHLRVGNWDEAKRLTEPLCSSHPADKELYLMLFCSATKNMSEFLYESKDQHLRAEAAKYWNKLEMLGSVTMAMKDYAIRRKKHIDDLVEMYKCKRSMLVVFSVLITFITICVILSGSGIMGIMIGLSILCWTILYKWLEKNKRSYVTYSQYLDSNPFKYE